MKPWEETWHMDPNEGAPVITTGPDGFRGTFDEEDAARLAAAAPAMARLLLKLEWLWREGSERHRCPSCDGEATHASKPWRGGHAPDCELATVLRAAGVLT